MRALVIGASGGIGAAMVRVLTEDGQEVRGLSRSTHGLDLTDEASIARVLGAETGPYDTIFVATGALALDGRGPEKSLRALDPAAMAGQFALNAAGPALALKHGLHLVPRDRPARFLVLSAKVGSIGDNALGGWYAYRAAKAALNQLIHTAAIEVARSHPQAVVALMHPGHVDTGLSRPFGGALPAVDADTAARRLWQVAKGLGPTDTGGFYDWTGDRLPW